jgi:hypothetical protein
LNNRGSVGYTIVESAYLKSHFDLLHAFNCCFIMVPFVRMNYRVFIVLFKLEVFLLEIFKVVEVVEARESVKKLV